MTNGKKPAPVSVRRSLRDPVVIAAIIGLIGGGGTLAVTTDEARVRHQAELALQRENAKCARAFEFLQDEAINTKLEQDDAFYQSQRAIAVNCSAERKKP